MHPKNILGKTFLEVFPALRDSVIIRPIRALAGERSHAIWKSPYRPYLHPFFYSSDTGNALYELWSLSWQYGIIEFSEKLQSLIPYWRKKSELRKKRRDPAAKRFIENGYRCLGRSYHCLRYGDQGYGNEQAGRRITEHSPGNGDRENRF